MDFYRCAGQPCLDTGRNRSVRPASRTPDSQTHTHPETNWECLCIPCSNGHDARSRRRPAASACVRLYGNPLPPPLRRSLLRQPERGRVFFLLSHASDHAIAGMFRQCSFLLVEQVAGNLAPVYRGADRGPCPAFQSTGIVRVDRLESCKQGSHLRPECFDGPAAQFTGSEAFRVLSRHRQTTPATGR